MPNHQPSVSSRLVSCGSMVMTGTAVVMGGLLVLAYLVRPV